MLSEKTVLDAAAVRVRNATGALVPFRRKHLQRVFGWTFGFAVTLGNMFGTGILTQPGRIARALGSPALIIAFWVLGGLFAFLGVLCLLELATMYPLEGGPYVFANRAFGKGMGFVVGWNDLIGLCAAMAYESYAFATYLGELTGHRFNTKVMALVLLVCLFSLQALGSHYSSRFESVLSTINAVALFAMILACFSLKKHTHGSSIAFEATLHRTWMLGMIMALQGIFLSYDVWQSGIYFSEEQSNPNLAKSLKSAMTTGVVIATGLFVLANLALLKTLPLNVLADTSDKPFPQIAQSLFGSTGQSICLALALLVMPPAINAALMLSGRVLFAMSRDHLFWNRASAVSTTGSPLVASACTVLFGAGLIVTKTFDQIIELAVFVFVVNYVFSFAALFTLRQREPEMPRPYRMWGYPWTLGAVLILATLYLFGSVLTSGKNAVYALAMEGIAVPVYFLVRGLNGRNDCAEQQSNANVSSETSRS